MADIEHPDFNPDLLAKNQPISSKAQPMETMEEVRLYLDKCIVFWRIKAITDRELKDIAKYYIDAFQSARINIFGELLPE